MSFIADPPGPRQFQLAIAVVTAASILTLALLLLFAGARGPAEPRLLIGFGIAEVMGYLSTSIMLFSEAAILNNAGRARLGTAYLFAASMFIPSVAIIAEPLQSVGPAHLNWLMLFLDGGFALLVLRYALLGDRETMDDPVIGRHIASALGLAVGGCALTTLLVVQLPWGPAAGGYGAMINMIAGPLTLTMTIAAIAAVAIKLRARTPADLWLLVMLLADCFEVGLALMGHERYTIGWYLARSTSLAASLALVVPVIMEIAALFRRLAEANRALDALAFADPLTGLANRRRFDVALSEEYRRARRGRSSLALVMFDIDQFKLLNDTHGHPAGDDCLRRVADVLNATARRGSDIAARVGGEEFALLLASTDLQEALYIADRVRVGVRALGIPNIRSDHECVTVSAGVAAFVPGGKYDDRWLVAASDRALYEAKGLGRDRVVAAPMALPVGVRVATAA